MVMKIDTVTFTQDSASGTQTTLDLLAPWLLKDRGEFNLDNLNAPQPPDPNATPAQPRQAPDQLPPDLLPGGVGYRGGV
jgi:hypothetical protein